MSRQFGSARGNSSGKPKIIVIVASFMLLSCAGILVLLLNSKKVEEEPVVVQPTVIVKEKEPEIKMVDVVIPVSDLQPGQQFEPGFFRVEKRPEMAINNRTVRDYTQVQNMFAKTLIIAGQPLHMDYVTDVRPLSAISSSIPAGFRAITINVNATSAVEGWAQPGSKVDVVWASTVNGKSTITTIVHNAQILSTDRRVSTGNDPASPVPTTVTLLVSAKDSQKIQLAATSGSLALALRGDSDPGRVDYSGSITLDDLIGQAKKIDEARTENFSGTVIIDGDRWNVTSGGQLQHAE